MSIAIITGSGGLVGGASVTHFAPLFERIVGIDNDMRSVFFGAQAGTGWHIERLKERIPNYDHRHIDIRDREAVERIFMEHGSAITLIIHAAAQPSHDKAAEIPVVDFEVNATGTLNLLEMTRRYCPEAVFIFTSTNKVYGEVPNELPFVELPTRWEVSSEHPCSAQGIDETMRLDRTRHSVFGVSKLAADVMVQEYGLYYGLRTGVFRAGCITGPMHSGTLLHGFLAYLLKCAMHNTPYTVFGHKGKQVRDNLHCDDLVAMFDAFRKAPRGGEVYNVGGGRALNCSVLEAITLCEEVTGSRMRITISEHSRLGDHRWYISDMAKFNTHYPGIDPRYDLEGTLMQMVHAFRERTV